MLLYIIIGLLIINLILTIITLTKNINESNITERLGKLETTMVKEISSFQNNLTRNINEDFNKTTERIDERLQKINEKVNERLDESFNKTNKTFTSVLQHLTRIDEAQKKIDSLSQDIISLQSVLTDKKTRGIFGEVNLHNIMSNIFGPANDRLYKMQYTLPNHTIADCVLFAPKPLGTIAIDSNFPLENYQRMIDRKLDSKNAEAKLKGGNSNERNIYGDFISDDGESISRNNE